MNWAEVEDFSKTHFSPKVKRLGRRHRNMVRTLVFFVLLMIQFPAHDAVALSSFEASCWGKQTALNAHIRMDDSQRIPYLFAPEESGSVKPMAQLIATVNDGRLDLDTEFHTSQPELGNPINIYAVMVLAKGQVLYFDDYTDGCTNPGISFFPSQSVHLATLKDLLSETLQIIIWARR